MIGRAQFRAIPYKVQYKQHLSKLVFLCARLLADRKRSLQARSHQRELRHVALFLDGAYDRGRQLRHACADGDDRQPDNEITDTQGMREIDCPPRPGCES